MESPGKGRNGLENEEERGRCGEMGWFNLLVGCIIFGRFR